MPWFGRKKVVRAPACYKTHTTTNTTMADVGGNGPNAPNEASSPAMVQCTDGGQPPKQAVIIWGGVRGCMVIKALHVLAMMHRHSIGVF